MKPTLKSLREHAIGASFFLPKTLKQAVGRLGFVQADPIRSPARAQDLILRHRVKEYRAGELEERYPKLALEEDFLYAYGFMPQSTWQLLHPRLETKLTAMEERVLEIVSSHRQLHPKELEAYLGATREVNGWGGYSKATTQTLHRLHYRGLLRISGRQEGIRMYEPNVIRHEPLEPEERLNGLVLLIASILAPLPEQSLREAIRYLRHSAPSLTGRGSVVARLIQSGKLVHAEVDGLRYVWPEGRVVRAEAEDRVRFLAPFDPLVWDRRRFEHFWGWPYRFEAYTPPPKRKHGYYAMPLLWRAEVIGWVNASVQQGVLALKPGFVAKEPKDRAFKREFEAERERFGAFLKG